MKYFFYFLLILPLFAIGQDSIQVGVGPEDMVLDTLMGKERLIISCNDWRKEGSEPGLWEYDFKTEKAKQLTVIFPTTEFKLRPHGVHLANGHLFVVNHPQADDPMNKGKKRKDIIKQEILRFRVMGDSLVMETAYRHKHIKAPNDVYAISSSEFYWTNFKIFGGNVCKYKDGVIEKVHGRGRMHNGLQLIEVKVDGTDSIRPYMISSTILGSHVYRTELFGKGKTKNVGKVKGGDNFSITKEGTLLLTGHAQVGNLSDYRDRKIDKIPSNVYELDLSKNQDVQTNIYSNDGSVISACTTAIRYKGFMYMSPLYDAYIIKTKIK
jgi:hypothetical protein